MRAALHYLVAALFLLFPVCRSLKWKSQFLGPRACPHAISVAAKQATVGEGQFYVMCLCTFAKKRHSSSNRSGVIRLLHEAL